MGWGPSAYSGRARNRNIFRGKVQDLPPCQPVLLQCLARIGQVRTIDGRILCVEGEPVIPVRAKDLPRQLEYRVHVVVAAGDINAAIAIGAPDDEVVADHRRAALEVAPEIEPLADPGLDNAIPNELHIAVAPLEAVIPGGRPYQTLRI